LGVNEGIATSPGGRRRARRLSEEKTMAMRNRILLAAIAVSAAMASLPVAARAIIDIEIAPPAPRVEVVPPPRVGYAWTPGYWRWNGRRHVWINGVWVPARRA